ncbi:MAG: sugar ABC transporter permease, partial [Clostridia bacterium]|nr:sugar ABC transporter permease [Clostridia bacterium]
MKANAKKVLRGKLGRNETTAWVLMIMPFLVLFFLFTVLPVLASMVLSFFNYDMISAPGFTGLANYLRMVNTDEIFSKAVVNTLKFAVVTGPLSFLLAYLLAWFINEFSPVVRVLLTFLFYVPTL